MLRQQDRVRAQVNELPARDDSGDDLRQLLMDQRFTARDRDHRCAALVHRAQRVLDAHSLPQDVLRMVDLAAAGTGQVALEERLQHQHERVVLVTPEFTVEQVQPDAEFLNQRDAHARAPGREATSVPYCCRMRAHSSTSHGVKSVARCVISTCNCSG